MEIIQIYFHYFCLYLLAIAGIMLKFFVCLSTFFKLKSNFLEG
jgi:hypothetical protein